VRSSITTDSFSTLANQLKQLEVRRSQNGLPLGEALLWRSLHAEILQRLLGASGDRRESLRVPCDVVVGGPEGAWTAHNFGPGGLGIEGEAVPTHGQVVPIEWLSVDGHKNPVELSAEVMWARGGAAGLAFSGGGTQGASTRALYELLLEAFLRA
jgi:hypothetical protein